MIKDELIQASISLHKSFGVSLEESVKLIQAAAKMGNKINHTKQGKSGIINLSKVNNHATDEQASKT